MKPEMLITTLVTLMFSAFLFEFICRSKLACRLISGGNVVVAPFIAVVAVIFALFAAANASDIWNRSRALHLSSQLEATSARSIYKLAEHLGEDGAHLRHAIFNYLNDAATTERTWLEAGGKGAQPAQVSIDALIHEVTAFANVSNANSSIKSLMLNRVDDLQKMRTERLLRLQEHEAILHWIMLTILAMCTQLSISLVHVGKPAAGAISQLIMTLSASIALTYLAMADGTIGPSRINETLIYLENARDLMRAK